MFGEEEIHEKNKFFYIKNQLLVANAIANLIGVFWVNRLLTFTADVEVRAKFTEHDLPYWIDYLFDPFAFTFIGVMTVLYERPIRRYLNRSFEDKFIPDALRFDARRRLLNEPFVLIATEYVAPGGNGLSVAALGLRFRFSTNSKFPVLLSEYRSRYRHRRLLFTRTSAAKAAGAGFFPGGRPFRHSKNAADSNPHPPGGAALRLQPDPACQHDHDPAPHLGEWP